MCSHRVIKSVPGECLCNPFPDISSPNSNKTSILDTNHPPPPLRFCCRHSPAFSHLPIASIISHSWSQDTALLIRWGQVRHRFSKERRKYKHHNNIKNYSFSQDENYIPKWKQSTAASLCFLILRWSFSADHKK